MSETKYRVDLSSRYQALAGNAAASTRFGSQVQLAGEVAPKLAGSLATKLINEVVQKSILRKYRGQIQDEDPDKPLRNSLIGTPLFDYIIVTSGEEKFAFQNDPMLEWEMQKANEFTEVSGGGEVLEQSGDSPIAFRIQGFLWDGTGSYPTDQFKDFLTVWRKGAVWDVSGRLFNLLNVSTIVVERAGFTAEKGFADTQYFEIACRSYKPVELEILAN